MARRVRLVAAVLLMSSCRGGTAREPVDRSSSAKLVCREDPSRSKLAPKPTREHCLRPPWNFDERATIAGVSPAACDPRGRARVFTHQGERRLSNADLSAFVDRHRHELGMLRGVRVLGLGTCCDNRGPCIGIDLELCTQSVGDIVATVARWWDAEGPPDARWRLMIRLQGETGPRCGGEAGPCLPEAYDHQHSLSYWGYRCDAPRIVVPSPGQAFGTCAHDGECQQGGCGNLCSDWTDPIGFSTCEQHLTPSPRYCGCVEGLCRWFSQ